MRNIFKTLSILFFGSIFFLSCEIGLGASVDTEAPNLEIQNPSPDAIIRGVFKIGGTWSDDGTIETVSVKLSRTDGKGKELEYQATFAVSNEDSPNTWNCIINPQDSANTVLDGNYIAQVDITDGGKHTTTKTVQFAIDNTAPVIVLQRPSTKIDALQVDSYGQKFTLEGQAADDNNVSLIEVQIYADKECTILLHTVPLSNVPNSINLDVAEFKENVETDYSKIYGSTQKSGQKNFYCKVVAYDGAVYYPYDRTQTPEDLKGNKTSIYYLYEDIATAVLGEVKITDVYHILSGVYGLEKESSRSAETNSLITKVKSALEKNVVNTGSFSLNPANNPTFSVSGKEPLQKDENGNVNFASGNYDITNGSQVIMEVTPGLDNIPLDGNSLKVYCIECDAKGTAKSGASKIYPATEMKKSGTTYKYTVSVKKQDGLVIGRNYLFGVDGYDEKKNNVVCSDNLGYGFHFSTSGAAPGLTILEPEAGSVTLANGKKLKISGTTTVEAGTPVITITDNKVNKTTLTFQESEATEDENKQLIYTFSTEIDFTGESAYHELEIVSDLEGIKTTRTKSVSYDSENPVIAINSVNPIVEKTESNGQPKKCLNGEVQISFSLTDDFSFIDTTTNKPYFELWQNNEKKYTATFTSTNSAVTETVTVDTKKLIDNTPLEIKVFTWDRAGNKAEYSDKQYQIDQSTDKPQITPKNNINFNLKSEEDIKEAGNNENRISMGGTVSFTVADDDGIDYIAVYSQTKDAQGKITETLYNRYPKEGSSKETQTPYSFILPSKSGYYLYRLEVKDIINTKAENNKQEYQFMIKATSPAPTIELISEEDSSTNYDNNADGYIKAGGAFVNTITVESVESPFTLWEKIDAGEYKKVENIKLENSEGKNYFKRKVSPIVTSTYYYKVEDSNEQYSSERSVKCKVDNDASTITPKSYPKTKQDTRVSQYTISGTAVDTDSGVNKVYIAFANEDKKYSDWKEVGGTENWYYTLKYAEDDNFKEYFSKEKHGQKYIKFKVVDKVGWEYETQAIQFFYDTADPTAEITAYKTEAADYTILTSAGVKTGKAFSLKGKATDDWGIETATLTQTFKPKQNESGEQQTEKSLTLTLELGAGGSWEVGNLPRSYEQGKENEAALNTGDYEYKLVVKDKAGNETQAILNVEVDTTAPVIKVNDLKGQNNNEFINTKNLTITGKIIESNFKTATAKLVKKGESNPFATGQISPDNDGSFSWKVYEVADGEYTVEVYAIDSFGNNTTEKGSSFTVDTIAPVSTLTATGNQVYDNTGTAVTELTSGSTYYVKDKYTLSGTVTETNFKSAKLGEETLTASSGTWSKEITPSDETTKQQTITLEDKAGNKTVYTVYVTKDTSAPLLTVTSPAEGSNAASITVTGQVSDLGIGVESVSYELYKDGVGTPVTTQKLTDKAGQFDFTSVDLTGDGKGEGKYKIKVTAQDKLGNKTTETVVNFMYDKSAPKLSDAKITTDYIRNDYNVGSGENQITYTVYAKDTFVIEVNATDLVSGVNTVTAESGNTKVTLTKDEQGNGTGKYTGTITAVLDKDNSTTITITATDFCNQTRTVSITNIMVDKVAPTISNLDYPTTPQKNKFTISVNASDVIALDEVNPVKIKYKKNESDETLPMTLNNGVYEIELTPGTGTDSASVHYIPDGNHTFTIEAKDKAGNKASESIEVITDVTKPTVSISKTPDVNATEGTVFVFEGTAEDGNGSGVSEIWMKFGENGNAFEASGTSSWLKSITFSEYSNVFNTSGEKKVFVMAKDRAGNPSDWISQDFIYDTKKPDAKISEYKLGDDTNYTALTSAEMKAGKAFSLKGIATDDWSVTSVRITQKQGERTAVVYENNKAGDWEVAGLPRSFENAEETKVVSGEYEYVLEVTDKAGKKTQVTMKAGIDTNAPEVKVEDPEGLTQYRFINTKNLTIKGNVKDANLSVAKACLKKENESSENYEAVSVGSDGSFSWKVYDVEEGKYQIKVYAEDTYGNHATETGNYFTVDTTAPVSTLRADSDKVYDRDGTAQTALSNGSSYYVKDDTFELRGEVTEENLKSMTLDGNSVTVTNNQWNAQITPSGETAETHTIVLEDKAGNKTVYTVYVTKDKSAPLLTVTSPTEGVNAASIKVRGQVSDLGIGVESVTCSVYKADGTNEIQVGTTQTLSGVAGQFEFNEVTLDSEGKYKVKISAQDKLGNKTEETVIETVNDKTGPSIQTPEIGEAKIADYTKEGKTYRVYAKDTFYLTVKVSDALSKVSSVTAESGSVSTSLNQTADGTYTGTVTVSLQEGGTASIKIKATDSCGNTSESVTDDIMVDKVAPTISNLTYPTKPQKDKFTISVKASDLITLAEDNPVKIKYKKNESDETLTMTLNNGVYEIELTPGTDSALVHYIPDGNHTFTIEATDKAGNKASQSIEVVTDVTKPTVIIGKIPDKYATEGTVFVFEGTANDGSGSGVSEILMKFGENGTAFEASGTSSWLKSITFSEYSNVFNTSGEKKVFVMAKDRAGNPSDWISQDFIYDTKKPDAKISEYKIEKADYKTLTSAGVKTGKAFSLKGSATDDWEVTSVTLTQTFKPKQNESGEQQTEKSLTLTLELGAGGSWEVGNLPRSYEQGKENEAALNTGDYEYKLVVKDKAGNETQAILNVEVDTTAPVIKVNDLKGQNNNEFINTKNLTITGKIIESNFKTATAKLVKDETSTVKNETLSPDQDGDFSWKVYEVADGEYTVEVYAEDIFENSDTKTVSAFTVDTTAPISTLTAAENKVYDKDGNLVTVLKSGSTYYVKGDYRLSGTVTETNFKSVKLGEEEFDLNADGITWDKEITPNDETTKQQTITLEDKAGNKTVYTVYVTKDTSAPLLTVTSPAEGSNTALITVTGQVSDLGIGVESVSYELYKVEDTKETKIGETQTLTNKAGQFDFTSVDLTGEGKGEGKYKIKVTAQDKLGNKTTETVVNFMYDKSAPKLSDAKITTDYIRNDYNVGSGENQITYTVYAKDTFVIEVNATDLVSGVNTVTAESGNTKVTLTEEKDEQGNGTGKYKGTITAVLNKDNITTITIKATDFCNQTGTVSINNIMVDKVAPTISNLTYPTTPQKDEFTISVSASDLIALKDSNPVVLKYKKNESDETLTELPMTLNNGVYEIELTPGTGTDSDSVHYIPDGNHTFTIEATDKAGNKVSKSIEVVTDVTAPTWVTTPAISSTLAYTQEIMGENNQVSETRKYYKSNLININVKATDVTSGVKEIVYNLDSAQNESTGNANITLDNLSEGKHTVSIKAVDEAGNVSNDTILTFYIDTKSPLKPELMSIDSESGAALEGYKDESKSKLVNGKSDVTFVLSASDASSKEESALKSDPEYMSGIKSVEVLRIASNNVNITGQKVENENGKYTITIPKDNLATGSVTVRITDNVGNTYEGTVFNLQLDNTPPVLKISSPADGATVNKKITISGATTDNNAVAQTVVTVKKGNNVVGGKTFIADNSNELSWSLDLDTFVQNITDNATLADLTITVNATDNAGNTKSETRTITVKQDEDRPKISFNNVTLGNAMNSSDLKYYIWLKNTTELYGTVEDDDGITSMQISNDGNDWKDVTLNTAKTSWKFDVKTFFGDETADKVAAANGAHKIYFKVTDAKEKEFTSATSSTLDSVYLVDGENKYGTIGTGSAKPDSVLYVKVDTLFPEVVLTGARIGTTGDFSTAYSNMTLGGAQDTMQFKLTAKDSNGIESVSGTAEFDGASVTLSSPEVKAYKIGESGDVETTVGASDAEYYIVSFTVDLAGAQSGLNGKDGRISLKFTGEDKAGNSSAQTATINYDYKKPEVTITSPKDSNWVSGIVTTYGTIDSAATMYYALSPSDTITPAEPDAVSSGGNITGQTAESETSDPHKVETWSGIDPDKLTDVTGSITVTPKYSQIKGNGVQWFVYFDNQPSTELATHDVEFKNYLINSGITTKDAIDKKNFTTIVRLYLWVKSIDLAGNVTEEKFPILIDPQGDAPQVTISYPEIDGDPLGGEVTLLGTASDTIGKNIGINNVWVQIMSDTNDLAAKPTIADVNLWINNGYTVCTDIDNTNPTNVTSDNASSVTPADCYIKANVSGSSWSLKINGNNEFSPKEGFKKEIVYRVYAQDLDNKLSKYQTQCSIFDADNPVLSDLYLRQYSNPDGTGTITASRPYEDDMWIKGDWWLCGTVKDTQGIKSLSVGGKDIEDVTHTPNAVEVFNYKISTTGRDAGNMKIKIEATDKATGETHKTTKECSINFDNKDPDSFEPVIANNKIQNANGFFTFSAEVKEDAVSGAAQSGFKYLAFYFTRRIKVNDNVYYDIVYDIMRSKTDENSAIDKSNSAISTEDGLIWKKLTVTRSSENLAIITLSNEDANIHTGRLCKIGGSIYMIKNANGTTIELDGSPEMPASGNSQEALFAIANVVNNNIESGNGTKSTSEDSYGYGYFTSISNDDGDHMVESVLKTGTTWKWEANINSRNIPDGEVTLHYVAFDAAGNYSAKEISELQIANNAPRLASVKVWTDYNGNGKEDDNEHATKYYSKKTVVIGGKSQTKSQDLTSDLLLSDNDKDEANDGSAFMTIKAETKLIPEIVGGNGDLYYTYKIKNNKEVDWSGITPSDGSFAKGNDDDIDDEAGNGGYYVVDDENTAYISGTIYDGKTTDKNPIEITTAILGGLENNTGKDDPTWFEYVIYDSTDGCKDWSDSDYTKGRLSAKFKVALNVQYNDTVKPQVAIRPFYWNSKTDNSVCWKSGSALGHIELEGDSTDEIKTALEQIELEGDSTGKIKTALGDDDPKVSGKIKIEGYAFDNIKLNQLYVQFAGHKDIGSKTLAATYTTSGSWEKSSTETATEIDKTWDFEATDVFNNSEGHLVYWTLTVDTQAVSGQTQVARLDQKVTVIAKDERGKKETTTGGLESASSGTPGKQETITGGLESASSGTPGKQEMLWKDVKTFAGATTMFYTDKACNNLVEAASDDTKVYLKEKWDYQMDIVPYITGVKTSLSTLDRRTPSKFDRTALGHYPVRIVTKAQNGSTNQAETVTFTGFNLGSNTSLTVSELTTENDSTTGGKSAKYSLSVNNIPTLNNMNNNNAKGSYSGEISDVSSYDEKVQYAYNRQPNNANNNRLTDDIIFDVWEFNSAAAVPISGKIEQPVMKIRPTDGKIGFAFVNGPLYFSMGGSEGSQNYSYQYWMASYDFFTSVGFTYDDAGNSWGVAAGGDINSEHADKFQLMSSKWGLSNRTKDGSYTKENSMRLESIGMKGTKVDQTSTTENFDKQRIRSPSLASTVHNGYTNLYLAYYDAMNDELRFKAGRERERGDSYVLQIKRTDNPGSNYAGAWVVPPNNNKDIFANGDFIYLCDKDGNLSEDKYYTLGGYYTGGFDGSGQVAFVAYDSYGNKIAPFPGTGGKNYTKDGDFHNLTDKVYIKVIKNPKSFVNGSSFYDFDTEKKPYAYRNSAVNIVAGNGVTGYGAGEYVSLGVVPGSNINDDVVVITWYDTNARTLYYSYNTTPLTDRRGTYNAANGTTGWSTPKAVFDGKDYDYAGEYCKIAVDKNGGIHIAAYDPVNLDLVYAYAPSYNSNFTTCVVDSNGVVGSNLTLDVALENGKAIPFIGYYATSCIKPKYARLVGTLGDGSVNDEVTGTWEISVVPTSSIIEMQSNQHNDINIGVWKDSGVIKVSTTGTSETTNTASGYSSNSNGQIFGNGTKNPVLGYAIKYGSSGDTIETAQMK